MVAINHRFQLIYFPIPKNATTSLKHMFYRIDTGRSFKKKMPKKQGFSVHQLYPSIPDRRSIPYFEAYTSFVVVRDPIKRFLSAYSNRVLSAKALEKDSTDKNVLRAFRLSAEPTLDEFVENLEHYLTASKIMRNHLLSQHKFVGHVWNDITHKIPIEQIDELPSILEVITKKKYSLPHRQTGGPKLSVSDLSPKHFKKLARIYQKDYDMLTAIYSPEKLR